jgi:NAD(P)H-quinone oxidoreductase subunit 5
MTTRVSIKVALAWSTCAQMGFLLVECGLGAWPLALLHLVAHSLYKAHAFLDAGGAVARWRISALALPTLPRVGRGLVAAAALTAGVLLVGGGVREVALAVMLGLALAPLGGVRLLFVVVVAVASHVAVGEVLPAAAPSWTTTLGWAVVMIGFAALYLVQAVMQARPTGAVTRALQPRLFAGLYLDERFTRLSFRIWPPRPAAATARPLVASLEVAR